jgi:ribosome maturation factor RimP
MKAQTVTIDPMDLPYVWRGMLKTIQLAITNPQYVVVDDADDVARSINLLLDTLPTDESVLQVLTPSVLSIEKVS